MKQRYKNIPDDLNTYDMGISQREYQRLRKLAKLGKIKGRDLER